MKRPEFVKNEIYHVCNRGIEKGILFVDEHDYLRFIYELFELNNEQHLSNLSYRFRTRPEEVAGIETPYILSSTTHKTLVRSPIVDVLAFSLMPDHFHLLLRERKAGGISKFLHRLSTGYVLYFNRCHGRSGRLFRGEYSVARIAQSMLLAHLLQYIHCDPLGLDHAHESSVDFLTSYRWSSHLDYCGWNNFPLVTDRGYLLDFFGGEEQYKKSISEWVKEKTTYSKKISALLLESIIFNALFFIFNFEYVSDVVAQLV